MARFKFIFVVTNTLFVYRHPIIKKLHKLMSSDPELGELLAKQVRVLLNLRLYND